MSTSDAKLSQLKKLATAERRNGGRPRYSSKIKSKIKELAGAGVSLKILVNTTGISHQTLRSWIKGASIVKGAKNFRYLEVSEQEKYDLVFPNGMMVKGLSFSQLLELADSAAAA